MLAADPTPQTKDELTKSFGASFADAAFAQPVGVWQGPVSSAYGLHLVRIEERIPARLPPLSEIRGRVHDDMMAERLRLAGEAAYRRIAARYHIQVSREVASP